MVMHNAYAISAGCYGQCQPGRLAVSHASGQGHIPTAHRDIDMIKATVVECRAGLSLQALFDGLGAEIQRSRVRTQQGGKCDADAP